MTMPHSELTRASDALAFAVAQLLPPDADPQLIAAFRAALGDLLAATLGGATTLAAGAVLSVDRKVDRLASAGAERRRETQSDVDRLAVRVHAVETAQDSQDAALHQIAADVEELKELKEQAAGDGDT